METLPTHYLDCHAVYFDMVYKYLLKALWSRSGSFLHFPRVSLASLSEEDSELLTNPDMLLMFERGTRGGITQTIHRYAKANNKYMGDKFNPKEVSSYLQYLDANNLCGWAMIQLPKLPT